MLIDIAQSRVSLTNQAALAEWNGVILGVLSHGQSAPVHLGKLLELAPEFAMGHALKGLSALMLGRRELYAVAQQARQTAQDALEAGGATRREQLWCAALQDWLAGKPSHAIARMEEALCLNPADTISMKLSHGIRFILGDGIGMRQSVEAVMDAHGEDHALRGYTLGCLAFAMDVTGSYDEAERLGLQGLEYASDDAWGLHAVTHVYDMTHRPSKGIALIDDNLDAWGHCNNFRFHVWWHKALLHLDRGEVDEVLALYDDKIRSEKTDDYRDFSNASSLLVRLELEGISIGNRWAELADFAAAHEAAVEAAHLADVVVLNDAFHDRLFEQCQNRFLSDSITKHGRISRAFRSYRIGAPELLTQAAREHRRMIELAAQGGRAELSELVVQHIMPSVKLYLSQTR